MTVIVAAAQMACDPDRAVNIARAESLIRAAAGRGANIVLLPELFETPYFPADVDGSHFDLARPFAGNAMIAQMAALAGELGVVLPVGFFERDGAVYYNSLTVIDADGRVGDLYRKSHIPEGPGYEEKHFFTPGDTGFRVWNTRFGTLGAAVCWDQWFPECARVLALQGAEILLYPTAIGNEPQDPSYDSSAHWRRVMQGHAAANMVPVVAANRVGVDANPGAEMTFYGSSFIADATGAIVADAPREGEAVITAEFDLESIRAQRLDWGLFRDRRPDLYGSLADGG
jgi:N-carbamoylputrescine amidase